MKKIYLFIFLAGLLQSNYIFCQGKFAATVVTSGNSLVFKLRPTATVSKGFSTIEFFMRYPTSTTPFTYGTVTANTINFPGMTSTSVVGSGSWEVERNNPVYLVPGFNVDHFIYTAPAPITTTRSFTIGVEYDLITVPVNGVVPASINFELVHQNTEDKYYLAITDEVGGDLRPLTLNSYFYPGTSTSAGPSGSTIYFMNLNVVLPVEFINFNATRNGNDALLKWDVAHLDFSDRFEVEAGTDPTRLSKIGQVISTSATSYSFVHSNISSLQGRNIYYRVKQVDKDGKFNYTEVRKLALNQKAIALYLGENPIKSSAVRASINATYAGNGTLIITDLSGKVIYKKAASWSTGTTNFLIDMSANASGSYFLSLINDGESIQVKFVK